MVDVSILTDRKPLELLRGRGCQYTLVTGQRLASLATLLLSPKLRFLSAFITCVGTPRVLRGFSVNWGCCGAGGGRFFPPLPFNARAIGGITMECSVDQQSASKNRFIQNTIEQVRRGVLPTQLYEETPEQENDKESNTSWVVCCCSSS